MCEIDPNADKKTDSSKPILVNISAKEDKKVITAVFNEKIYVIIQKGFQIKIAASKAGLDTATPTIASSAVWNIKDKTDKTVKITFDSLANNFELGDNIRLEITEGTVRDIANNNIEAFTGTDKDIVVANPDIVLTVASTAFNNGDTLPSKYAFTSEKNGTNVNPPLSISNIPVGTNSLVLWVFDEQSNTFPHWIIINVPITKTTITEGDTFTVAQSVVTYTGPSPPPTTTHTYTFVVFALSDVAVVKPTVLPAVTQGFLYNFYSTDTDKIGTIPTLDWNVLGTATTSSTYTGDPNI